MFLIPEAPRIQGNTLGGKGSDYSRVKPTDSTPWPLCLSVLEQPAKSTYTAEVSDPGRQNTLSNREGGETRM